MANIDTYKDMVYFDEAVIGPSINFMTHDETDNKFYHYKYYIDSGACIKDTVDEDEYASELIDEKLANKIVSEYLKTEYDTTIENVVIWVKNNVRKKLEEAHDAFNVFFYTCGTEPMKKESIVLKDDDIIYLSCTLAIMMDFMKAYNLNPEEDFFFHKGESMKDAFIHKMKELGVGEATIGAIVVECGGGYIYKDDGSEEDEEIISLFMPDTIKERLGYK